MQHYQPFLFTSFKISLTGIGLWSGVFFYHSILHTELVHEIPIVYSHHLVTGFNLMSVFSNETAHILQICTKGITF